MPQLIYNYKLISTSILILKYESTDRTVTELFIALTKLEQFKF